MFSIHLTETPVKVYFLFHLRDCTVMFIPRTLIQLNSPEMISSNIDYLITFSKLVCLIGFTRIAIFPRWYFNFRIDENSMTLVLRFVFYYASRLQCMILHGRSLTFIISGFRKFSINIEFFDTANWYTTFVDIQLFELCWIIVDILSWLISI